MLDLRPLVLVAAVLAGAAPAQTVPAAERHPMQVAQAASGAAPAGDGLAEGEVRKIDLAQGKLTLKHGPIASLEMPAMTMVFKVADPKLLHGLKDGDPVRFRADRVNGVITVTAIQAAER